MSKVDDLRHIWQDREIRFDISPVQLRSRRGEESIDSISSVEDTKGNNGEKGILSVTNLRIKWCHDKDQRTNLSVGFNCVINLNVRAVQSHLQGNTQGLYVMTKFNRSRFEFIFTSINSGHRLFSTIQAVHRSYETTKLYRDLKLRGAIIRDKQLIMLPDEESYTQVNGVYNLSNDQGTVGTFFVTNIRLVWHAKAAENFNVSIPYLQIKSIKIRESKFGPTLVIETTTMSGGYVLGFRIDPKERLQKVEKELKTLHEVFSANPNFGVQFSVENRSAEPTQDEKIEQELDDIEIIQDDQFDVLAAYYADRTDKDKDRPPVYNKKLGLAVETLKKGVNIEDLWKV